MKPGDTRVLGKSGLAVTQMGFGGAPLGNMYRGFPDAQADATVRACYDAGIRLFDTAPLYGFGLSEHRVGAALRDKPRDSFVLSTKVGRLLRPGHPDTLDHGQFEGSLPFAEVYDYSYDGVMRSVEDSLQRIGTYRIDILLAHDLDVWTHGSEQARVDKVTRFMAGGYRAMRGCARRARSRRSAPGSTRPRHAGTWPNGATSTASCSPAATRCSSRRRSTASCRCARSRA